MTARPVAAIVADLRGCADVDDGAGFHLNATVQREAADALVALDALLVDTQTERDMAQAVLAEVRAALDQYEADRIVAQLESDARGARAVAALDCVSAVAKAVRP